MLALFRQRPLLPKDRLKAVMSLFADGGGLASWPGPAAVLRCDGATIIANAAAGTMSDALGFDGKDRLQPDIAAAIRAGYVTTVAVDAPGADGTRLAFTVLPLEPGVTALALGRDTALETAFRDALSESRQRYKDLVEISGDFCWETGPDGRFVFVSPRGALGYRAEALVGRDPATLVDEVFADGGALPFLTRTEIVGVDVWMRRADGTAACLETTARPLIDAAGALLGARGLCRDVTAQRERESEFHRIEMHKRLAAHIMQIIHDEVDPPALFGAAARALMQAVGAKGCRLYGQDADGGFALTAEAGDDAPDDPLAAGLLARARSARAAVRDTRSERAMLCVATSFQRTVNGALLLWRRDGDWSADDSAVADEVAIQLGVAMEQMRIRIELEAQSRTDGLTGLLNRRAFTHELARRLDRDAASASGGALFYVDLDNFKPVNDVLGHQKGDEALCALADLLRAKSRPGDLVARLGGDEFALWLDRTDHDAAAARGRDLLAASACLDAWTGDPARPLGVSIGIAVWRPGGGETLDALTARADSAMYDVKHNGKAGLLIAPAAPVAEPDGRRDRVSA